jgi:hypothetical protein
LRLVWDVRKPTPKMIALKELYTSPGTKAVGMEDVP